MATVLLRPIYLQGNYRLTLYQKTLHIAVGTCIAAFVNIVACMVLIPRSGIHGAAFALYFATVAVSLYMFATSLITSIDYRRGLRDWPAYLVVVLCSICLCLTESRAMSALVLLASMLVSGLYLAARLGVLRIFRDRTS
jgi:O-antigen/teichoic acid export membrane protein